MVILGYPDDVNGYVCADGELAVKLQQWGFHPKYKDDDGCLYFKRTSKLLKVLVKLGEDV